MMDTLLRLVLHRLRRDRLQIPIWILSIAGFVFLAAVGLQNTFGSLAERTVLVRLATANPAIMLLRGPPQGTDLDALLIFTVFGFLGVLAGLMNTFLAVRHLRAEEESGRASLISATPAARVFPPLSTLVYGFGVDVVLALAVAGCFLAAGQDLSGSIVAGLALGAVGIVFLGVGAVASELMASSRAANGVGVGAVLLAYLLRGLGDAFGTVSADGLSAESAWPSWLSPIGWAQQTHPFTENTLAPLILSVIVAAALMGVAGLVLVRRDSGASVLASGAGREAADPRLSGAFGLAWRLQWPSILAWSLGGALFGVFGGSLGTAIGSSDLGNGPIADELSGLTGGTGSLTEAFVSVVFTIVGVIAAGSAIQSVVRLRQEEALGTGHLLLATPLSRLGWLVSYLAVGVMAVVLVLASGAAAAVVSSAAVGAPELADDAVLAAVAQVPAALLFLGAVATVWALLPHLTAGLGWGALILAVFLGIFGQLIGLPDWTADLSPFTHSPQPAGADTDWTGGIVMAGIALAAGVAASVFFRRRDIAGG
ncbi:ABC-2 type transport system permease protein [Mycetocola sp. CAN_C7]|uniref:ABC transporter permease n=1 Tax=Mycetocola sp. CAN_C7 TaxID=2787724 RepID=UPI0018CAA9ED